MQDNWSKKHISLVGEKIIFCVTLSPLYDHCTLDGKSLTAQVHYFNSGDHEVSSENVIIKKSSSTYDQSENNKYEISYIIHSRYHKWRPYGICAG